MKSRLKSDEVRCEECKRPLPKSAAVVMNGVAYHPIKCFEVGLQRRKLVIDRAIERAARGAP